MRYSRSWMVSSVGRVCGHLKGWQRCCWITLYRILNHCGTKMPLGVVEAAYGNIKTLSNEGPRLQAPVLPAVEGSASGHDQDRIRLPEGRVKWRPFSDSRAESRIDCATKFPLAECASVAKQEYPAHQRFACPLTVARVFTTVGTCRTTYSRNAASISSSKLFPHRDSCKGWCGFKFKFCSELS